MQALSFKWKIGQYRRGTLIQFLRPMQDGEGTFVIKNGFLSLIFWLIRHSND